MLFIMILMVVERNGITSFTSYLESSFLHHLPLLSYLARLGIAVKYVDEAHSTVR